MEIIPAIDVQAGRVVRLRQGAFGESTDYGGDPVAAARRWVEEGAPRLHLVDLDGAREGRPLQSEIIRAIISAVAVPCQVAGGLRDDAAVESMLSSGADRVVLGTRLLIDPGWAARLVSRHGRERIVAAIDVRDGQAVGDGWVRGAVHRGLAETLAALTEAGVDTFVVTAVRRDGLLIGPDLDLLAEVAGWVGPESVIASGGMASLDDVQALADAGYAGTILGRALYDERISLPAAVARST